MKPTRVMMFSGASAATPPFSPKESAGEGESAGFTLLEMTVVLLIIALIAAGVAVSHSIQVQANKRAIVTEIDKYTKAVGLFLEKYGQLPGDYTGAGAAWGADASCPSPGTSSPKVATCSGDGNGTIGSFDGTTYTNSYEWFRGWQHLANAGMIEGQYSGMATNSAGTRYLLDCCVPRSEYTGGGYVLLFTYNSALTAENFARRGGHVLQFGGVPSGCSSAAPTACITQASLLKPSDARDIDQKIDDGKPGLGKIMSRPSTSTVNVSCSTTTDADSSEYNISYTQTACALIVDTGY